MTEEFEFKLYPKIYGPFKRFTEGRNKNKLDFNTWSNPAFEVLKGAPWYFSEKVDGTNIRVGWDGHKVRFGGRTDRAQLPMDLVEALEHLFPEELLEQTFGERPVILYGEGYGAGIQKGGGNYRKDKSFVMFDVRAGRWWLEPEDVRGVSNSLGIFSVPSYPMTLDQAMMKVTDGLKSKWGDFWAEGLVGVVQGGLLNRDGSRIQVKVKHKDFFEGE